MGDGDGLHLLVHPNGSKYWQFRYHFAGKERTPLAIGKYPEISLAEARDKRFEAQRLLNRNIDPNDEKRREKREAEFSAVSSFDAVAKEWKELKRGTITDEQLERNWRRLELHVFPWLGKRPVAEIRPLEVLSPLKRVEQRGHTEQSRRLLQLCSSIFRYAVITGRIDADPSAALGDAMKPHRGGHYPTLRAEELPEFLGAFAALITSEQNKLAFRLLLLTAVRTGEMRYSKWENIDLDAGEWRIPASIMKMRRDHLVPLSRQAVEVLQELRKITNGQEWLVPSQQNRRHAVMSENTITHMLKRMGYKDRIVGHGFRALFSTIANEQGFNRDAIERQLAHVEGNRVRAAYNRAEYVPERREMMQWWADYLDARGLAKNATDVVSEQ